MTRDIPVEDIFQEAGVERFLYQLRESHPELAYEIDEITRAVRHARDRLLEQFSLTAPSLPAW